MKTYTEKEMTQNLQSHALQGWKPGENVISKQFSFKDFKEALAFMVKVGDIAEELNHHPDWSNVYNKVNIKLSTHDAGGVTDKDFELAKRIEELLR